MIGYDIGAIGGMTTQSQVSHGRFHMESIQTMRDIGRRRKEGLEMMHKRLFAGVTSLLACVALFVSGCPSSAPTQTGPPDDPGVTPQVVDPTTGVTLPRCEADFSAILSANRSVLVRDSQDQGSAKLTIEATCKSTYVWSHDAPDGMLEIALDTESDESGEFATSTFEITGISGDPGANGTEVLVTVEATAEGDAAPRSIRSISLLILRPEQPLTVSLVPTGGNTSVPNNEITLTAEISGGEPFVEEAGNCLICDDEDAVPLANGLPYCICWSVTESAGIKAANTKLIDDDPNGPAPLSVGELVSPDETTTATATYAVPVATGSLLFKITVSDASGGSLTRDVSVSVNSAASLVLVASAAGTTVAPGDEVGLTAFGVGGEAPYSISMTVSRSRICGDLEAADAVAEENDDEDDDCSENQQAAPSTTVTCDSVGAAEECEVAYQASSTNVGNDIVTVEIEDAVGAKATTTVALIVASNSQLNVTASADPTLIEPNDESIITASITGGSRPYTVCFRSNDDDLGTLTDSLSNCTLPDFGNCTCGLDTGLLTEVIARTYQANTAVGTDNIEVFVTDSVGATDTAFVSVEVASAVPLSVSAVAEFSAVGPGNESLIEATVSGGEPPYSVCFELEGVSGADLIDPGNEDDTSCVVATIDNLDCLNVPTTGGCAARDYLAPSNQTGSSTITVEVVDAVGALTSDVVVILVSTEGEGGNGPLDLVAFVTDNTLVPGQPTDLTVTANGGVAGTYQFQVTKDSETLEQFTLNASLDQATYEVGETPTLSFTIAGGSGDFQFDVRRVGFPDPAHANGPTTTGAAVALEEITATGVEDWIVTVTDVPDQVDRSAIIFVNAVDPGHAVAASASAADATVAIGSGDPVNSTVITLTADAGVGPFLICDPLPCDVLGDPTGMVTSDPNNEIALGESYAVEYAAPANPGDKVGTQTIHFVVCDTNGDSVCDVGDEQLELVVHINVVVADAQLPTLSGSIPPIGGASQFTLSYVTFQQTYFDQTNLTTASDNVTVHVQDGSGASRTVVVPISTGLSQGVIASATTSPVDCAFGVPTIDLFGSFTGVQGIAEFAWGSQGVGVIDDATAQNTTWTLGPNDALPLNLQFDFQVTDTQTQDSATDFVPLFVADPATASVDGSPTGGVCTGEDFTLNGGPDGMCYLWTFPDNSTSTDQNPTVNIGVVGAGDITLTVGDPGGNCMDGCLDSTTIAVGEIDQTNITDHPDSLTSCIGEVVVFTVAAVGSGELEYMWVADFAPVDGTFEELLLADGFFGGDTPTLTLPFGAEAGNAGEYKCFVKGDCDDPIGDGVDSNVAVLTISPEVAITAHPQSAAVCVGDTNVVLSVSATGAGTLHYQWRRDGVDVGADLPTFTIAVVAASDIGTYTVEVSDDCTANTGTTVTSNPAVLSLDDPPIITQLLPPVTEACTGVTIELIVVAIPANVTYEWFRAGVSQQGPNADNSYDFAPDGNDDGVVFSVEVVNDCGTETSETVLDVKSLSVSLSASVNPVCEGQSTTLLADAQDVDLPATYEFIKDGDDANPVCSGSQDSCLISDASDASDEGSYEVRVTDQCGTVTSAPIALTVNELPIITVQPVDETGCDGEIVQFTVTAGGDVTSFQWFEIAAGDNPPGTPIGGDEPFLDVTLDGGVNGNDGSRYRVVVSGLCDPPATSDMAVLTLSGQRFLSINPVLFDPNDPNGPGIDETGGPKIVDARMPSDPLVFPDTRGYIGAELELLCGISDLNDILPDLDVDTETTDNSVQAGPAIDPAMSSLVDANHIRIVFAENVDGVRTIEPGAWTAIRYAAGGGTESIAYLGYLPGDVDGDLVVEQNGNSNGDRLLLACWVDPIDPPSFPGFNNCQSVCMDLTGQPCDQLGAEFQWDINRDGALTAADVDTWTGLFTGAFDEIWAGQTLPNYGTCCLDDVTDLCENATEIGCETITGEPGHSDFGSLCGDGSVCPDS